MAIAKKRLDEKLVLPIGATHFIGRDGSAADANTTNRACKEAGAVWVGVAMPRVGNAGELPSGPPALATGARRMLSRGTGPGGPWVGACRIPFDRRHGTDSWPPGGRGGP